MISYSHSELEKLPRMQPGDTIRCPRCEQLHVVDGAKDSHGDITDALMSYGCGETAYLCGVSGRRTM